MSRLFDVVTQMSGQRNNISIPRPYISFCKGDYNLAAVLAQLVFLSGMGMRDDGWFWKKNEELGDELGLTVDQVRYSIKKLKLLLGTSLETCKKKAYGTPTTHYRFNEDLLVKLLFPNGEETEQSRIGKITESEGEPLPPPFGKVTESKRENYRNHGFGKITESITDPITNIQILINMSRNFSNSQEEEKLNQFLSKHPDAFIYTPVGKKWGTEDDLKAASYIFNKIVEANPTAQVPNWFDWANDIRLLRTQVLCDKFSKPHHEICRRFKIANQDDFWNKNILSPTKLRKHWDRFHSVDPKSQSQINWESTGWAGGGSM
ncbi:hypothetical protein A9G13_02180 [Gilliamella sp. wkB178]|uniref:hypothetical protein n=1 Tax=Gilliamella sp. wkB178 TaxID=3120259 RepID=UPI00080E0464|nr:hypothetical protein [Gilliamella apicola]OCG08891.1 hypothetical protein A9G13_02180 [Gilliamella apicola]